MVDSDLVDFLALLLFHSQLFFSSLSLVSAIQPKINKSMKKIVTLIAIEKIEESINTCIHVSSKDSRSSNEKETAVLCSGKTLAAFAAFRRKRGFHPGMMADYHWSTPLLFASTRHFVSGYLQGRQSLIRADLAESGLERCQCSKQRNGSLMLRLTI